MTTPTTIESRYLAIVKSIVSSIQESLDITRIFGQASSDTIYSAPIFRLPVEILVEIFGCLNEDANYWRPRGPPIINTVQRRTLAPNASLDPAILAQVCMLWRAIALSTPTLWSSIAIHCTRRQPTISLLQAWLERSGTKPLRIVFVESIHGIEPPMEYGADPDPVSNPFSSEAITLLMAHSHRWKAVDFNFSRCIPGALLNLQSGSLPMLETAALSSRAAMHLPYFKLAPVVSVWNVLHSSLSFTRGCWEIDYLESNPHEIPWSRLTSVELTMMIPSFLEVLPKLENLVDLHFIDPYTCFSSFPDSVNRERPSILEPVTLPCLRKLHLVTANTADPLFNKFTLPSLVFVHVTQKRVWLHQPVPSVFTNLLTRSGCNLKEYIYDISGDPVAEDILLEILSSSTMASLQLLTVESTVTEKFTRLLTRRDDNTMILPQLERLSLQWCKDPRGGLLAMAQSRSSKAGDLAVLRRLQVRRWDKVPLEEEGFNYLAKAGMSLKL
ncbi:hypothetical protein H2248_004390 [Termitomyces sp. 'cryptogamus']|nr:hypothetical protein H2248_004390 [Termitomyces sp. 'cryptogamus']